MAKQILMLDETPLLASVIGATLGESASKLLCVDLARSAVAALKLLKQKAYDLLLVNYQTENIDSLDILRQVRDAQCRTEAVVVAGWLTPQLVECGSRLGVERIYRLPAEYNDFTRHLRSVYYQS